MKIVHYVLAKGLFKILEKYRPETTAARKDRLRKAAEAKVRFFFPLLRRLPLSGKFIVFIFMELPKWIKYSCFSKPLQIKISIEEKQI